MQVKRLFFTITILFSLLFSNFSQAQRQQPKVVSIPDANLAAAIRQEIGNVITTDTILNLTRLDAPNHGITDLTGLEHAGNLRELDLGDEYIEAEPWFVNSNTISDFSPIAGLTRLTRLNLSRCGISDASFVSDLTQLTWLDLGNNTISDISALANLKQLNQLYLWYNTISDVSALAELKKLTWLMLVGNTISDVSPLAELKQLPGLGLGGNNISDVSPLAELKKLTDLSLWRNMISDVSPLAELTQLTRLRLSNNNISDIAPLVELNLTGTEWDSTGLDIRWNPLSYASINTHIPAMQAKGVEVAFENRTPTTLVKISGIAQQGIVNTALPLPFTVEVRDEQNKAFAGVPVTFSVATGGGKLSATTVPTDAAGRAAAHLTLGRTAGTTTVRVSAAEISQPVQFTATAVLLSAPVTVSDAALHAAITSALGKAPNSNLTVSDMLKLTTLAVNSANIRELAGLEHASNLTTLSLNSNNLSDIAPLAGLSKLTTLSLNNNHISDVTPLAALAELQTLSLENNNFADVTPLSGLTQLETLSLDNNRLWNVSAFIGMSELRTLSLENNDLSDVAPLTSLRRLKTLELKGNLLSYPSLYTHIPALQARGATVRFDPRTPTTLVNVSGTYGVAGTAHPIAVKVQDAHGFGFSGVPVTFTVIAGGGQLNTSRVIADSTGSARTTLTLGSVPGKNTVRAAAAELLRSVSFSITAVDANSGVIVPDANLRTKIIETLGKTQGVQLTAGDMLGLTRLDARNANIQNLTGLEHARNLRELNLGNENIDGEEINSNAVSDPSPIAGLTRLTRLNLSRCGISDASFVSGLTQLTWLNLGHNTISDISPLANLIRLNQLYLWYNTISDVSALAALKKLTWLMLTDNTISDVSPLAELTQLRGLGLGSNRISDISPLAELKKLTDLSLWRNMISGVSPLAELTQLTRLRLSNNNISDIAPLVKLNLTGTEWDHTGLDVRWNPLSYASINTHIPAMQAKGVEVAFENRTPTTLVKISGIAQQGIVNTALPLPFTVEVRDEWNAPFSGVPVTFTIATGGGTLSATTTTTDTTGRAEAHLRMGQTTGTTTVRVTAVDVSQSVEFTATAILRSSPVIIPDANLRARIMETLRKPLDATPTAADMLKLTTLTANNTNIHNLTGLQYASNLTSLSLNNNRISNVSPLAGLTQLTTLDLRDNWISDVSSLVSLTQLRGSNNQHGLSLQGNPLSDTAVRNHIPQLQAAGVNVGFDEVLTHERPIVRLIYFRPRDRQLLPGVNIQLDRLIKDIQQFYADQMESHGFGRKTFQFETDADGNAVVYHVIGKLEDTAYHEEAGIIWDEIHEHLDRTKYIYLTALDVSSELIGRSGGDTACGVGGGGSYSDGYEGTALLPASGGCFDFGTAAHELGHAFGLSHDFRNDAYLMSYGWQRDRISECAAEWLDVHSAFNPNQPASTAAATIEMLPPSLASPPNAIRLRFKVTDPDGLHQVQLLTPTLSGPAKGSQELIACKHLNGESSNTVNFVTTSLGPANEFVSLQVIDVNGNFRIQIADRTYATSQEFSVDVTSLLPPSKVIRVPDRNLAAAIREEIGNAITTHTVLDLTRLDVPNRGITDLTGLEHAHNLRELNLSGEYIEGEWQKVNSNAISDFSPIAGLTRLTRLNLSDSGLSDVSFLSGWTQLDSLSLNDNSISDISALANLTQLDSLSLNDNSISDFSPIAGLTRLTQLNLSRCGLSDVSFLSGWTQLDSLSLNDNTISDISPLATLTQLTSLYLRSNTISDVSALATLTQLTSLYLGGNIISDISPLAQLTQLTSLSLWDNTISDVSPLTTLKQLTELRFWNNIISDVSSLAELTQLTRLQLNNNIISDVSPLAKLKKLTYLDLRNNTISDVSPIVELNLIGTEWDRTGLDIRGNPLSDASINTHIPAMRTKGIVVAFDGSDGVLTQEASGEKIVGPWLWVITPTDGRSGASAAASGIDFLSEMSDGAVTESKIATEGATAGSPVGDSVWTLYTLSPTRSDNINDMAKAAGLGIGDIDYHVAYGSIALEAPREQQTIMHVGSDDAVKVWLNGELVHNNPVNRGAWDFQDQFSVTLKKGTNILLVAVYEGWGAWTGFFGFAADAEYTLIQPSSPRPAWDVNEDGIVDAKDVILVAEALGQEDPENPRLDVNGDGVVDGKDLVLVAEHLGEGDAPAASYLGRNVGNRSSLLPVVRELPLGFTLESVEQTLNILRAADDGTLAFKRGIANLERLLALFVPENTALLHNYPNPFNPETWIPYQLAKPAEVTLHIYAVNGALVRTLALGYQPAGVYRIRSRAAYWDGRNAQGESVASGVYFYSLFAGDFSATRKMLIRK